MGGIRPQEDRMVVAVDPGTYGWSVITFGTEVHTVPVHGTEHSLKKDCWCSPQIVEYEKTLVIHNEQS